MPLLYFIKGDIDTPEKVPTKKVNIDGNAHMTDTQVGEHECHKDSIIENVITWFRKMHDLSSLNIYFISNTIFIMFSYSCSADVRNICIKRGCGSRKND